MADRKGLPPGKVAETVVPGLPESIHSCNFCYIQELDPNIKRAKTEVGDLSSGTIIRYRGSRVLYSATNGCTFFKNAAGSLESILNAHGYEQGSASPNFRPENWIYELFFSDHTGRLETASGYWMCAKGELPHHTQQPRQEDASYLVLAYQDDPAAETIPIRPFLYDFGEKSASWVRRRLWECELLHQSCKLPDSTVLPTRLLKIDASGDGSGLRVQLYLTALAKVEATTIKYATLSYCWGGPQTFQLNTDSEGMLMAGFPASLLPKTLRDAVQVVWDLGIRWIWIDSLCIRQDNLDDKAIEVARMHRIYGSSFITISASRASSCAQGFLHHSSLPSPDTVGYKLPFASPSNRLGSVVLSKGGVTSPIDDRGWTLQEHLLAHRVLRFTDYQLHWSCSALSMFEQEKTETLPSSHVRKLKIAYEMYKGIRDQNRGCRHWMNVVQEYTLRRLTDGLDTLPAMSGIAESWARTSKDDYLAGLWRSHLPLGLLWTSAQPFRQGRLGTYRAPSWSWASLVGQVDWFDHLFTAVDPRLQVVSCIVTPVHSQAPYGAVQSGHLIMHGLLQRTVIDEVPTLPAPAEEEDAYLDLDLADVHLDFWDEELSQKSKHAKLFCLQICTYDQSTGMGPSGLIVATIDDEEFSRLGFFTFEQPQRHDVEEIGDFDKLLALSDARKLVQRSAFENSVPRRVKMT